ncbi:NADP-dependent oxidoreductase domain-containing protein [Apodospora peruviana]|uniref:NADP-dependent oxidoreductase domain-containing protein n=1 Tax=Apodospora peruviana TaxID=516989 RepID=A0AAE0I159_9PEZI|nr:NADP-dependent oxidoreductase domain-containing protein [Apodospora peruviana]
MSLARPEIDEPPTELGRLRILSSTAGIRVSPLALGGGNIGQNWNKAWGHMTQENATKLLDAYFEAGGNFIDTANAYQEEESEFWIGEWMSSRQIRDNLVIATKYTSDYKLHTCPDQKGRTANHGGNHRRSLHMSVRDSLRKLQTDYIDILYVHWWDYQSSIEEVMDSLHLLIQQGKVLYLGVSDTPAWVVSAANTYAKLHGKTQFSVYSGKWNVMTRDFEREILPMARHFGMALTPWGVLGGGKFQSRTAMTERERNGEPLRPFSGASQSTAHEEMSDALAKVAGEHGTASVAQIALAYVLRKAAMCGVYNVFPVVGGRKVEQLEDNIAGLKLRLTDKQVEYLESVTKFEIGFPGSMIGQDPNVTGEAQPILGIQSAFLAFPGAVKARESE